MFDCIFNILTLKVFFLCLGSFGEVVSSGWSAGRVAQKKFSEVEKWQISKFEAPRFEALNAKVLSRSSYVFSWAAESSRPLCRCSPLCCRCRKAIGQGTFAKQIPVEKKNRTNKFMFIFAQTFAPKNLFCFNWFRVSAPVDEDSTPRWLGLYIQTGIAIL